MWSELQQVPTHVTRLNRPCHRGNCFMKQAFKYCGSSTKPVNTAFEPTTEMITTYMTTGSLPM